MASMDQTAPRYTRRNIAGGVDPERQLSPQRLLNVTDENTKRRVTEHFFGIFADAKELSCLESFFKLYNKELRRLRVRITLLVSGVHTKPHEDLVHIRDIVFESRTEPRSMLRARLRPNLVMEDNISVDRMVNLTIHLWLMVNVHDDSLSISLWRPQQFSAKWDKLDSLVEFLAH